MFLAHRYLFVFDLPECYFIDLTAITAHEIEDRLLGGATAVLVDPLLPPSVDPTLPPTLLSLSNTNMTSTHTLTHSLSNTHTHSNTHARPTHARRHAHTHAHTQTHTHSDTLTLRQEWGSATGYLTNSRTDCQNISV